MRPRLAVLIAVPSLLLVFVIWHLKASPPASGPVAAVATPSPLPTALTSSATPDSGPTAVFAHNLMLRKGPNFRIYVRWLRGNMVRTRPGVNPTFDDPESFFLEVKTGVIRANIGDIGNFLNAGGVANSPLTDISLLADGDQIRLKGTLHKLVPLPVELLGTVVAAADSRIQLQVTKLSVLKLPLKGFSADCTSRSQTSSRPRGFLALKFPATTSFSILSNCFPRLTFVDNWSKCA